MDAATPAGPTAVLSRRRRAMGRALVAVEFTTLACLGNVLAMQLPGSTPFLVGNMAAAAMALRFGAGYGLLVAIAATGVTADPRWVLLALLEVVSISRFRGTALGLGALWWRVWWPLAPVAAWLTLPEGGADLLHWATSMAVVLTTGATSLAGGLLLQRVTRSRSQMVRLPLGTQLSLQLATLTAAPATFALMLVLQASAQRDLQRLGVLVDARAGELLAATTAHLERHRVAIGFAAAGLKGAAAAGPTLVALSEGYPGFLSLLSADAEGRLVASMRRGEPPVRRQGSVADRDYFQLAIQEQAPVLSSVFRGRGIGSDVIVAVAAPLGAPDRPGGILQGALGLGLVALPLRNRLDAEGLHHVLIDRNGRIVLASLPGVTSLDPAASITALAEGPQAMPWWARRLYPAPMLRLDPSDTFLVAKAQDGATGWGVAILQPTAPVEFRQTVRALLGALVVLGMILGMQWLALRFAQRYTRDLTTIVDRLENPHDPAATARRPTTFSSPELATLARDIERITELRTALSKAEHRAEAKSGFLANMSHELRTPLTAILGFSERALRPEAGADEMRNALQTALRQGRHLLELVNDILDASKIESGHLRVQATAADPVPPIRASLELLRARAEEKGLALALEAAGPVPERATIDTLRLKQIVLNLVGNAIKFTARGGVTVLLAADRAAGTWSITVADTGIGLTDDQARRIFERFEQADESTTRQFGGTGLGLYISRQLARQMGGDIVASGRPGVGSRFVITLPLDADAPLVELGDAAESEAEPAATAVPHLSGRVLVVDDVEDLRLLLVGLVGATGATVIEARNGLEAVEAVDQSTPDLVLMDMHMPVMDGREAVRRLRASGYPGAIFACSADVLPDDVAAFLALGCTGALAKPIDLPALYAALQAHLPASDPPLSTARPSDLAPPALDVLPPTPAADPMAAALAAIRARFIAGVAAEREGLAAELERGARDALKERAHRLKGSAGTFGFPGVTAAAAAFEAALKQGEDAATIAARGAELDRALAGLE